MQGEWDFLFLWLVFVGIFLVVWGVFGFCFGLALGFFCGLFVFLFVFCALACLEEETRSKILNKPDLVQMLSCIREIIFQTPCGRCLPWSLGWFVSFLWGKFGWKKKLLHVCVFIFTLLLLLKWKIWPEKDIPPEEIHWNTRKLLQKFAVKLKKVCSKPNFTTVTRTVPELVSL